MAERIWTPEQDRAIKVRHGDLIISAAAGSGKTAVLCERVIQSILDKEAPVDISEMLIVTFTEASAEEMRVRIGDAIRNKMKEDPSNSVLFRQLMALQSADIGTIHSFCKKIVSANTSQLGLGSEVHVVDSDENEIMAHDVMQNVIDRFYRTEPDFPEAVRNFVDIRDDRLADILLGFYKKTQSTEKGIGLIDELCREYSVMTKNDWENSRFAKLLVNSAVVKVQSYISEFREGVEYVINHENPKVASARGAAYSWDLSVMEDLVSRAEEREYSWDLGDAMIMDYSPKKCAPLRNITDPVLDTIGDVRDSVKDILNETKVLLSTEFSFSVQETVRILKVIYKVFYEFERDFSKEKKESYAVDFTDLERMAYRLLVDKNGDPTLLARDISTRYKQIYIDEYQDTNSLQDAIFKAISRENRFMVGDIKQSIYGFRGAEPSIFAKYRDSFSKCPENGEEVTGGAHSIFLSNNFRCDRPIVEFSNLVFGTLFTNNSLKIKYLEEDKLKFSKQKDTEEDDERVSIILCKKDDNCAVYSEALIIADRIKALISRGTPLSSIAVIMRSAKDAFPVFKKIFEKEGIPVGGKSAKSLLDIPEILFLVSLMNIIDNPHRDIYFASVLSSNIFGINFNETVAIATECSEKGTTLYNRFKQYTETHCFDKGEKLLKWLQKARREACGKKIYEIVEDLCSDFAIYALAATDTEGSKDSRKYIEAFKTVARDYEKNSYRGLYSFLRYIDDVKNGKASEDRFKVEGSSNNDCVKLLTIHQSKGLEFEYCFVARCGKGMNLQDCHARFLLAPSFGAGFCVTDRTRLVKFSNPLHKSVSEYIFSEQIDEEMRVLYVALTRARKKLFVTAEVNDIDATLNAAAKKREHISRHTFRSSTEYISWILAALDENTSCVELLSAHVSDYDKWKSGEKRVDIRRIGSQESFITDMSENMDIPCLEDEKTLIAPALEYEGIRERLEYIYPYEKELSLPAKMAVSRLFPDVLDVDSAELVRTELKFTDIPKFVLGHDGEIPTGAMRGTATHVFMQFCDFENAEKQGIEIELARLCDNGFIDRSLAELVYIDRLKKFFLSPLYGEIKRAKNIWREKRFSIMLPASEFTGHSEKKQKLSEAKLLVQGVFDCLFEKEDGTLKLIDYKTDSVSGNVEADEAMFAERYTTQLSYYKRACEMMMKREISEVSVYSFSLGREVTIPVT